MFKTCLSLYLVISALLISSQQVNAFAFETTATFQTAPKDSAKKDAGLLKKLADALKFRKNALTKEKKRVLDIIDEVLKDSSITTKKDLGDLKKDLTDANKAQYDTLLSLIQAIKAEQKTTPAPSGGKNAAAPSGPDVVTDPNTKYVNALIDKLVPILKDNREAEQQKAAKQKQLKTLRAVYNHSAVYRDTINDSTAVNYSLKIKHRAEVWGLYSYGTKTTNFDYKVLSSLDYFAYNLNGKTGYSKNFAGWDNVSAIDETKHAYNKVVLSVFNDDPVNTATFLTNQSLQDNLINSTLNLLSTRNADGVNITFRNLNKKLSGYFVTFISRLNKAYKTAKKPYSVTITLPSFDKNQAYDINSLDTIADYFVIDFSTRTNAKPGPTAPLNQESDYSIESCVSRYLNSNVAPYKFILQLPYNGTLWKINPVNGATSFVREMPYNEIRTKYQYATVEFDKEAAASKIDLKDANGVVNGQIWYDDENTLDEKYDFVLKNGLGGVAVSPLGADEGYGELWDALASKFLKIDTVYADTVSLKPPAKPTWWDYIKTNLSAYYRILEHPCSDEEADTRIIKFFNIVWIILTLATAIVLVSCVRKYGDGWKWKKIVITVLIVEVHILVITIFMWLYLADEVPWFGAGKNCIDMPFSKLLLIILSGIALGTLVMRFLIFPAIKKDDKP